MRAYGLVIAFATSITVTMPISAQQTIDRGRPWEQPDCPPRCEACPPGGMCLSEIGGSVSHGSKGLTGETPAQLGGVVLEQLIIASRDEAINGAMPIPPQIRQALTGYASTDSMNRVRYKIGDSGFLDLANILELGGFVSAVTLIDVIVFRGPSEANNPSIWAHELAHVDQYRDWGVHGFAIQYVRDYNAVEAPAYAKGNAYWAWAQSHGRHVSLDPSHAQ